MAWLIIYCSLLQCNISLFKQKIIEIKYFILRQGVDVPKLYKKYAYSDLQKYTLKNYLSGFCCAVSVGIILSYNLWELSMFWILFVGAGHYSLEFAFSPSGAQMFWKNIYFTSEKPLYQMIIILFQLSDELEQFCSD